MMFLDNKTDRQTLDLITKHMSVSDINKSMYRTGLVQVERTVMKPGVTPFRQKFWVKPDQVKPHDVVLFGKKQLEISKESWDSANQFYEDCGDDEFFYEMLHDGDVTWEESDDPKENLTRAKRALAESIERESQNDDDFFKKEREKLLESLKPINRPTIDSSSMLTPEDQKKLDESTDDLKKVYNATGLYGTNDGANEFLSRYKNRLDDHFKKFHVEFSQEDLEKSKQQMYEDFEMCAQADYMDREAILGDSPNEFLRNYRDEIVSTLIDDPQNKVYAPFKWAVQRWSKDIKDGKISKDDPDIFFMYAREDILKNDLQFDFDGFRSIYGINLKWFVTKDSPNVTYDEKTIKAKITSLDTQSKEYKDLYESIIDSYNPSVGSYNSEVDAFETKYSTYKIKNIYKIEGLPVENEFQQIKNKNKKYENEDYGGKNGYQDTFFHGTTLDTSFKILGESGRFKQGEVVNGLALGPGLYLAEAISKSMAYMDPGDKWAKMIGNAASMMGFYNSPHYTGCVFICDGSLGNCEFGDHVHDIAIHSKDTLNTNWDSVGVPAGKWLHQEWKVNNTNAVVPRYIMEIEVNTK